MANNVVGNNQSEINSPAAIVGVKDKASEILDDDEDKSLVDENSFENITKKQIADQLLRIDSLTDRNGALISENQDLKDQVKSLQAQLDAAKKNKPAVRARKVTKSVTVVDAAPIVAQHPQITYSISKSSVSRKPEANIPDISPISDMETKLISAIDGKAITVTNDGREVQREVGDVMPMYGRIEKIESTGCIIANGKKLQIQGASCE